MASLKFPAFESAASPWTLRRRLSEPSSSNPAPAKSVGSTANSVESIFRPPELFRSKLSVVPDLSKPSPATIANPSPLCTAAPMPEWIVQ